MEPSDDPAKTGYIETHGFLEPRRRYVQRLEPGQKLVRMSLVPNTVVKQSEELAVLSDDALNTQVLTLEERRLGHLREMQERDLLRLEVEEASKELRRVTQDLEEERRLEKQLPDYFDGVKKRELEASLRAQGAALRTRKARLDLMNRQIADAASMQEEISMRLHTLRERVAALTIKADFSGRVVNVAPYPQNLLPGDVLFEIWDDDAYRVVVDLWQNQVGYVRPGNAAEVISDFDNSVQLRGEVRSILPARTNQESRSYPRFPAVIELENGRSPSLRIGMSVAVRIHVSERQ